MPLRKDVQEKKKRAGIHYEDFWKIVSSDSVKYKGDGTYISTQAYNTGVSTQIRTIDPMCVEDPFAITKIEVTIKSHSFDNEIVIGMCEYLYPIEYIPSRSNKLASSIVAFNISEGLVHVNSEHPFKYNPCTEGDVVKCVISSSPQCKLGEVVIEFYCNNLKITEVVCTEPDDGFFGLICLAGKDEEIIISPPEKEEMQNCVDRFEICTEFVEEEGNGVYKYVESNTPPDYSHTLAIGMIRSIDAIDPGGLFGRLLVRLLDKGKEGAIAIGFCSLDYPNDCLPGWKEDSAALHIDINSVLYGSDQKEIVSDISVGDVIECIVEPIDNGKKEVQVIFQNNGIVFSKSKMWCPSSGIFWSIGMMSIGEKIQIILPRKVKPVELPVARFEDIWYAPLFNVNHLKDGICVHTDSLRSRKLGTIRSKHPIDPLSPFPFFDIKIISCVIGVSVGVGVCEKEYPFPEMPGLISRSIGFNCNEGSIHQSSILPDATRSVCKPGDVIRCTVSAVDGSSKRVQASFSVNGIVVQTVFDWTPPGGFFGQIGFHPGNKIQIASPLMRPSVLRKGISNRDLDWNEFSLTLDVEAGDVRTAEEYVNPPQHQQVHNLEIEPPAQFVPILVNRQNCPCDHQLYQVLYSVKLTDCGIEHANDSDLTNGYVICRKQMSEKLSYFEVEIIADGPQGVAVGVCDGEVYVNECIGKYENSVAFVTSSGSILSYSDHSESVVNVKTGDVIGCLIEGFQQKSNKSSSKNLNHDFRCKAYFFKNASLFGEIFLPCSMTYLYPTICLIDPKACVQIRFSYGLSPHSYFDSHKIANGYLNYKMPAKGISIKWNCIQNCSLIEDGTEVFLHVTNSNSSLQKKAAVIQNDTPFSLNDSYFEAELLIPSHLFLTLSIGACPKLDSDNAPIPGEVENSVGFAPLSGLIMRNKDIASYASDHTVQCTISANEGLLVGVGIHPISSQSGGCCVFFFTVNRQEVAQIVHPIPSNGLYPTLAFTNSSQCVSESSESKIFKLNFPKSNITERQLTPQILPWGIARVSQNFSLFSSTHLVVNNTECTINAVQASTPVSPSYSYFEATVIDGGDDFSISIGLTTPAYSLDQLVGLHHPSIGYHLGTGCLVHNSVVNVVSPKYTHVGVQVGCGVVFPEDGSRVNAEVYFTVDRTIVAQKLINIPLSGFYPSFAMHTNSGILDLHIAPCNPFPDLAFNTRWHLLHNIIYSDSKLQLISSADFGLAQLYHVISTSKPSYTTVSSGKSWKSGKLLLGFSNCDECPLHSSVSEINQSVYLDITSNAVILISNSHRQYDECPLEICRNDSVYGFGVECHGNSHLVFVFFTLNNKVVYRHCFNLRDVQLRPSIFLMGTTGTISINTCAGWPPETSIGTMWGRFQNVKIVDNHYLTFYSEGFKRSKMGFAQASKPLNHEWNYFEVEIVHRDPKKAIAVGIASNNYDMSNWVGWKKDSIAYHADDGRLFFSSGLGAHCGPMLFTGDIVGCGVKLQNESTCMLTAKVEVFFTVNRSVVGKPILFSVPVGGLFPTVCVESPSEVVNVVFDAKYASSIDKMSRDWVRSICVVQVGNRIEHQLKQRRYLSGHNTNISFGYCQATLPCTVRQPYFEIEILEYDIIGNLSIGIAPLQQKNETNIVTGSVLAFGQGKVVVKQGFNTLLPTSSPCQRFQAGDLIGCKLNFNQESDHPETVSFTQNGALMTSVSIPSELRSLLLHPTICFPNCIDSVVVYLNPPLPKLPLKNLIGWIRTEQIKISGRVVEYRGDLHGSVGAGQISSMLCHSNSFFEIEVLDLGEQSCLSIGAASVNYLLNYQPGWKPDSIGFHGDDGCLFIESGRGCSFGPPWTVGDIVGFGVRPYEADVFPENEVQTFITINGIEIGHTTVKVPHGGLFPIIGFNSKNEKMKVDMNCNCGFATDLAKLSWRTLCGVQMKQRLFMSRTVLQFLEIKRRCINEALPLCSTGTLGLAVAYQAFSSEMQYFEVEVLNYGKECRIAIGVVSKHHSLDSILGWSQSSLAYHTHAGHLYKSSKEVNYFGPVAHIGDRIGCGYVVDLCNPNVCSIFFTLNGFTIGHHVKCPVLSGGYYPAIGLFSPKDKVSVVFSKSHHLLTPTDSNIVGLMRIHNCSYSDNILTFNGSGVKGPGNAHFAVPLTSARNFFSVSLLNINDHVVIGLVSKDFPVTSSPGKQSFSIAYDVLAGNVEFAIGNKRETLNVQKSDNGDIIGCSMVPSETKPAYFTVYFLVNQQNVCEFKISDVSAVDWFPVVGFKPVKRSSHVYVNWSHSVFEPQNIL